MQEHSRSPTTGHLVTADGIEFRSSGAVDVEIGVQRICCLRVFECNINLSRDALIALGSGSGTFADVDFVDPISGDEHQAFDHAQTARPREIVYLNLAVLTVQSEHPNLPGAGDCVRERSIHRRIGFKSL